MKNGISRRRLVAALPVAMASLAVFSLSGCSDRGGDSKGQSAPLDLTGSWVQAQDNRSSDDSWQEAVIEDGEITINWMSSDGTSALYWVGSYEPPTEDVDVESGMDRRSAISFWLIPLLCLIDLSINLYPIAPPLRFKSIQPNTRSLKLFSTTLLQ